MKINKRYLPMILVVVLLLGAVAVGAIFWDDSPVMAQLADDDDDAGAGEDDDSAEGPDVQITGEALERASQAALDYLGEGRVTDTEVGDEEGYYEVEVTLENGREVDVHLDEEFNVLGQEAD